MAVEERLVKLVEEFEKYGVIEADEQADMSSRFAAKWVRRELALSLSSCRELLAKIPEPPEE